MTVGADICYDTTEARNLNATPHVAQNIYSPLLNDSARNGMIAANVVQAIPAGRCPLLLSLLQRAMRNGKYETRGTTGNEESASCSSHYGFKVPDPSLSANQLKVNNLFSQQSEVMAFFSPRFPTLMRRVLRAKELSPRFPESTGR